MQISSIVLRRSTPKPDNREKRFPEFLVPLSPGRLETHPQSPQATYIYHKASRVSWFRGSLLRGPARPGNRPAPLFLLTRVAQTAELQDRGPDLLGAERAPVCHVTHGPRCSFCKFMRSV